MAFIKIKGNILNLVQIRTITREIKIYNNTTIEGVEITYIDNKREFLNVKIEEVEQAIQEIQDVKLIEKSNKNPNQKFGLGDTAYMIDEDYRLFEGEVYKIELDNGKYYYSTNVCDFEDGDIGKFVFKSEIERELYLEALK